MPEAPIRILIVAALCGLSLIGLVVRESMARAGGTEVLLAMEAVDPRALLSGHYVIVTLQERRAGGCPPPPTLDEEQERDLAPYRWLSLSKNGTAHSLSGTGRTRNEALTEGDVAVLGTGECTDVFSSNEGNPETVTRLELGVERFHIAQADAERIDRLLREQRPGQTQRIFAIVSIGQDGRARLKGLQVDGERLELNWL